MSTTVVTQAIAAQNALRTLLDAADAFDGILVDLGPPLAPQLEHAWVSCVVEAEITPGATDLSRLNSEPELAMGIMVTQYAGRDWSTIRTRMTTLAAAAEAVLQANPTLSATCSYAYPNRFSLHESIVDDKQIRLTAVYVIATSQYAATSG